MWNGPLTASPHSQPARPTRTASPHGQPVVAWTPDDYIPVMQIAKAGFVLGTAPDVPAAAFARELRAQYNAPGVLTKQVAPK